MTSEAIDELWSFSDPVASEARFREALSSAEGDAYVEILTQIARAQGLQQKFDEAHATLDQAEGLIGPGMGRARVRVLLERGRALNSSGKADDSVAVFEQAIQIVLTAPVFTCEDVLVHESKQDGGRLRLRQPFRLSQNRVEASYADRVLLLIEVASGHQRGLPRREIV